MGAFRWLGSTGVIQIKPFDGVFGPGHWFHDWLRPPDTRLGLVLDTETTGLDPKRHKVIEIGMRLFEYSVSNEDDQVGGMDLGDVVCNVVDEYDAVQDPGEPLSQTIREITGLTDADLAGQRIDVARVHEIMSRAGIVIAHNAGFDRPFVDRLFRAAGMTPPPVVWACSDIQIDWRGHGLPTSKLDVLCPFHGFYGVAHRAGPDAASLLQLLSMRNYETRETYLHELLTVSREPWERIAATNAPYEAKDVLKRRRYNWSPSAKVWSRMLTCADHARETEWLSQNVYHGPSRATVTLVDQENRFAEQG